MIYLASWLVQLYMCISSALGVRRGPSSEVRKVLSLRCQETVLLPLTDTPAWATVDASSSYYQFSLAELRLQGVKGKGSPRLEKGEALCLPMTLPQEAYKPGIPNCSYHSVSLCGRSNGPVYPGAACPSEPVQASSPSGSLPGQHPRGSHLSLNPSSLLSVHYCHHSFILKSKRVFANMNHNILTSYFPSKESGDQ